MAFVVKLKRGDEEAVLNTEQFRLVDGIILKMMNGSLKRTEAEAQIIAKLELAGKPIQFKAKQK